MGYLGEVATQVPLPGLDIPGHGGDPGAALDHLYFVLDEPVVLLQRAPKPLAHQ